jgi:anti-sigma regulatory factor (Ser/Thr protein kinase)
MRLCPVSEQTHVASVRREAAEIARAVGLPAEAQGRLSIVATELATNQLKHARHGEILVGTFEDRDGYGVELIGMDTGPGIADLGASMRDGHSTAGTPGQGLGALQRQSDQFDIVSWPQRGVAVLSRIYADTPRQGYRPPAPFIWGGISIPIAGEVACGDAFSVRTQNGHLSAIVSDGLGHGPLAAAASQAAVASFSRVNGAMPVDILRAVHEALRPTRGAAVAALRLDGDSAQYAGIGNIAGVILRPDGVSRMVSVAGTAGVTQPKIRPFAYRAGPGALVVLTSDGISTSWKLDAYPGLTRAHPSLVAAIVFRDFSRRRDDATVVAIRMEDA